MKEYIKYLNYLLRHKWYVMIECFKYGLIWRGLTHDLSKFFPSEFIPFAKNFSDKIKNDTFQSARLSHHMKNKHHWQHWVLSNEEMREPYITEMICDWAGAKRALSHFSSRNEIDFKVKEWYEINKDRIQLSREIKKRIESILDSRV